MSLRQIGKGALRAGLRAERLIGSGPYRAAILADAPTIFLALDELTGTVCADSSGNGNTFTYQAGVTLGKPGLVSDGGTSIAPPGSSAAAVLASIPAALSNPAAFTLEAWVNLTSTNEKGCFITVGGASGTGYAIGVGGTTMDNTGNNLIGIAEALAWKPSGVAIGTGVHQLVMTRDAAAWKFYKDGALVATTAAQAILAATGAVKVGGYTNGASVRNLPATESLDCVAAYPVALSATRIAAHWAAR